MTNQTQKTEADAIKARLADDAAKDAAAAAKAKADAQAKADAEAADAKAKADAQAKADAIAEAEATAAENVKAAERVAQDAADLAEAIQDAALEVATAQAKLQSAQAHLDDLTAQAAPPKPVIVSEQLRELIAMIEAKNTELHRVDLMHTLHVEYGATMSSTAPAIIMAGVTSAPAQSADVALKNWCSAARRAIMSGAAA